MSFLSFLRMEGRKLAISGSMPGPPDKTQTRLCVRESVGIDALSRASTITFRVMPATSLASAWWYPPLDFLAGGGEGDTPGGLKPKPAMPASKGLPKKPRLAADSLFSIDCSRRA